MTPDANALDVERLREIAGKATPGDWPVETWYGSMDGGFAAVGPHHLTPDGESDEPGGVAETRALADARFIATFNPTTALALLPPPRRARSGGSEAAKGEGFRSSRSWIAR